MEVASVAATCVDGCGRPVLYPNLRMSKACYIRWVKAGRPAAGPPPPLPPQEAGARSAMSRGFELKDSTPVPDLEVLPPDAYDIAWARKARARREREPEQRADRMIGLACRWVACVRNRDMHGVSLILQRLSAADKDTLLAVLAETADPWQLLDYSADMAREAG